MLQKPLQLPSTTPQLAAYEQKHVTLKAVDTTGQLGWVLVCVFMYIFPVVFPFPLETPLEFYLILFTCFFFFNSMTNRKLLLLIGKLLLSGYSKIIFIYL